MGYVCIHGHFYQPPRENPWLEEIEVQDSAAPYHDWNDRITVECYRPNDSARIVDGEGFITQIVNNYSRISFNFGPTLLSWLEYKAPDVYHALQEADRKSLEHYSGHGSAVAQAYNHLIMPLANRRDKETQAIWGIRDFEHRFGRKPEGMWLPETAVDDETLNVLAEQGIKFTILAPSQAGAVRDIGSTDWSPTPDGSVDTTQAYRVPLAENRTIVVFFYDGSPSHDIAFGNLLSNGGDFARRLVARLQNVPPMEPLLSHIATDGETYGHHQKHGEMALAFALRTIEEDKLAALTNYGEFLALHPPKKEAQVVPNTSWSCAHGIERWRSNCGCNAGRGPGWQQEWRGPLRAALDWLRDAINPRFEQRAGELLKDPWKARNDYIRVVLDRSPANEDAFFADHARRALSPEETTLALQLLELERQLQLMYTSCGWFFDDIGGIETVQILEYAGRAVQLAEMLFSESYEAGFKERLAAAPGNVPENGNGSQIYDKLVRPNQIDLQNVCAHYALSSLFESYEDPASVYCYRIAKRDRRMRTAGAARLVVGQVDVTSEVTRETGRFTYGVLYIGGSSLFGGVRPFRGDEAYTTTANELIEAFDRGDVPETIRRVDRHFGAGTYTLRLLFRDEQRKIVGLMLDQTLGTVQAAYQRIYETTAPLLRNLAEVGSPAPSELRSATEFYLNHRIRTALEQPAPDLNEVAGWIDELARMHLNLETESVAYAWARAAERLMERFATDPGDLDLLRQLNAMAQFLESHPSWVDLSVVQNRCFRLLQEEYPVRRQKAETGDAPAKEWVEGFTALAKHLKVRIA
jgi:alpha-amylase/alpha-mannosidase (GH57 family)